MRRGRWGDGDARDHDQDPGHDVDQLHHDVDQLHHLDEYDLVDQYDLDDADTISRWAGSPRYDELRSEIGDSRYYIVVMAYDFKRLVEKKERKLLWVTRMSISVRGNSFQKQLHEMVARAGRYFGRNSRGLVREFKGTVELGETEVLGYVEEPAPAPAPAEKDADK